MHYNHSKLTARLVDLSLVELVRLHYFTNMQNLLLEWKRKHPWDPSTYRPARCGNEHQVLVVIT